MCACDATRLLGFLIFKRIFYQGRIIRRAKSLSTFLVFAGGEARLWEGCSISAYVLGILDGVAMLWFDVLDEESV